MAEQIKKNNNNSNKTDREVNKNNRKLSLERKYQIIKNPCETTAEIDEFKTFIAKEIEDKNNLGSLLNDFIAPNLSSFNCDKTKILLDKDINLLGLKNKSEQTILHGADLDKAVVIMEACLKINNENMDSVKNFINIKDVTGKTALSYSDAKTTEMLIELGGDINSKDKNGKTILFGADLDKAIVILEGNLNKNNDDMDILKAYVNEKDKKGKSALYYANPETLEMLIEIGGDINSRNKNGKIVGACSNKKLKKVIQNVINDNDERYIESNKELLIKIKNKLEKRDRFGFGVKSIIKKIENHLNPNGQEKHTSNTNSAEGKRKKVSFLERINQRVKNYQSTKKAKKVEDNKNKSKERAKDYLIEEYFMQGKNIGDFYNDAKQKWGNGAMIKIEPFQQIIIDAGRTYALSLAKEILISNNDQELEQKSLAVKEFCENFKQGIAFYKDKVVPAYNAAQEEARTMGN